jgi:hypothetical protein
VKRTTSLRHLRRHGCTLKREGRSHSPWMNPGAGATEAVPRHTEIPDNLARKICRGLSIPELGRSGEPADRKVVQVQVLSPAMTGTLHDRVTTYQTRNFISFQPPLKRNTCGAPSRHLGQPAASRCQSVPSRQSAEISALTSLCLRHFPASIQYSFWIVGRGLEA